MGNLRRRTGLGRNLWARAALGYSLSLQSDPAEGPFDSQGTEFQDRTLFGPDQSILMALLRQRLGRVPHPNELNSLIKRHVERGLRHFARELDRLNKRGDELLFHLLDLSASSAPAAISGGQMLLPEPPRAESFAVRLDLGPDTRSRAPVFHTLNSPGCSPHIAIMGRNGTGKTRTGLSILSRIHETTPSPPPFLVFDYGKGDIAENSDFVQATQASVLSLPGDLIPLAPLSLAERSTYALQIAARRFRDTICSVVRLGPVQKDRCLRLIMDLYEDQGEATPDLTDLAAFAEREYRDNDWPEDSLLACLREFSAFPLFRSATEGAQHDLFKRSYVFDIHRLPEDLRKLTAFLVLDRLYSEIMNLPDAPLDKQGDRHLRMIILIDEAHHYLPCRQPTLENIVREVRSKGVAIMLLSQSPDDFDQPNYNFAREMGLSLVFSCVVQRPKMLEALLGGKIDPRRMSHLEPGVALTRIPSSAQPLEIQAWKP